MVDISAVDLFCGAGGLSHGLLQAKVKVVAGFDIDPRCRHAYETNNSGARFFHKDVAQLSGHELSTLFPSGSVKLLAGCAPCQPFSTYSQGRVASKSDKWPLLYAFSRLIREVEPDLVTMENVPDVVKHRVYHDFERGLMEAGYQVWAQRVFCPDYGLPQRRSRHVLLASRMGPIKLIEPTVDRGNYATVRSAIGALPPIAAGQAHSSDRLHVAAGLSPKNTIRIKASKPGGTWKDWPQDLVADCHAKPSGRTYSGVYARMSWDEPSPTMTTQCYGFGNGRFGHPEQDRAISIREAAILQSFPEDYEFVAQTDPINISVLGRLIGNAVPVKLGEVIGQSMVDHLG